MSEAWAEEIWAHHVLAGSKSPLGRKLAAAGIGDPGECLVVSSDLPIGEALSTRATAHKFIAVVGGRGNVRDIELIRIKRLA